MYGKCASVEPKKFDVWTAQDLLNHFDSVPATQTSEMNRLTLHFHIFRCNDVNIF